MATEFEVAGKTYQAGNLPALTQFHLVRRMAPALSKILPALQAMNAGKKKDAEKALEPLAEALAALSDDDANYVLFGLLSCVKVKEANGLGWSNVSTGNQLMYDTITMPQMLQLAWGAFNANLAGFFPDGLSISDTVAPKQKGR